MAGAVKAWVEQAGLGVAAYRDGAPNDGKAPPRITVPLPCVVIQEGIGSSPELHGDYGDPNAHLGDAELVQVDLLQYARIPDPDHPGQTNPGERYSLVDALSVHFRTRAGSLQQHAPWRVYGVTVDGLVRFPPADNIVRHSWTLRVRRDTARST